MIIKNVIANLSDKPVKKFDYGAVRRLAGLGLTREQIAISVGCSRSTVQRRLRDDPEFLNAIELGQADMVIELSNVVKSRALKGDLQAACWLLERRGGAGWQKSSQVDVDLNARQPLLNIILTGIAPVPLIEEEENKIQLTADTNDTETDQP